MAEFDAYINVSIRVRVTAEDWQKALEKVNQVSVPLPSIHTAEDVKIMDWDVNETDYVIDVAAFKADQCS